MKKREKRGERGPDLSDSYTLGGHNWCRRSFTNCPKREGQDGTIRQRKACKRKKKKGRRTKSYDEKRIMHPAKPREAKKTTVLMGEVIWVLTDNGGRGDCEGGEIGGNRAATGKEII